MVQRIQNNIGDCLSAVFIHVIREVVEMEQIYGMLSQPHDLGAQTQTLTVYEVATDSELRISGMRVAHGSERSSLESMESLTLFGAEIVALKNPSLGLCSCLFVMAIGFDFKVAVREEIR